MGAGAPLVAAWRRGGMAAGELGFRARAARGSTTTRPRVHRAFRRRRDQTPSPSPLPAPLPNDGDEEREQIASPGDVSGPQSLSLIYSLARGVAASATPSAGALFVLKRESGKSGLLFLIAAGAATI
jgi:hypothetical protein